jgi:hypothetical protein
MEGLVEVVRPVVAWCEVDKLEGGSTGTFYFENVD